MKLILAALLVTLFAAVLGVDDSRSHFYRTFNKLHKEPDLSESPVPNRSLDVKTNWIAQKLDHFDGKNDKTWMMV